MTELTGLFSELSDDLQASLRELGWSTPMPVQAKAIPLMREGGDLIIQAQTGSGKTGAFGIPIVDVIVAWLVPAMMGIVGIEIAFTVILDFYRPRLKDQEPRMAYDSRLLGILAEGGGLLHTISEAMNYQFGFKVSETWFYRFMEKAVAPLVIFQILTFWALSCFVIIGHGEEGYIEHWGKVARTADGKPVKIEAGLHTKWPWPIDQVKKCNAAEIRTLAIGEQHLAKHDTDAGHGHA